MKQTIVGALGLVCGLAVATSAFAGEEAKKDGKNLTLTGCLKAANNTGTVFKLTDVSGGSNTTMKEWELRDAPAALKMADHVGHKVSVTGTVATTPAKNTDGQNTRAENAPRHLQVQSFKHVAATCP